MQLRKDLFRMRSTQIPPLGRHNVMHCNYAPYTRPIKIASWEFPPLRPEVRRLFPAAGGRVRRGRRRRPGRRLCAGHATKSMRRRGAASESSASMRGLPQEGPVQCPVQCPVQHPTQYPVQRPTQCPVQCPVQRPTQRPRQLPARRAAPRSADARRAIRP